MKRTSSVVLSLFCLAVFAFALVPEGLMAASSSSSSTRPSVTRRVRRVIARKKPKPKVKVKKNPYGASVLPVETATYTTYSPAMLKKPGTAVFFFWPNSCGSACKSREGSLTSWYKTESFALSTYKVKSDDPDYAKLARSLRVSGNMDTFIKARVEKNATVSYVTGLVHPMDEKLMEFLRK